ncbi:MAG: hypothetical protein IID41_00365 [Planctomycetes bacterium]|nr:hypothetical protein [Planctomycetota bacterium]
MAAPAISPPAAPIPRLNAEAEDPLQTNQIKLAYLAAMRSRFSRMNSLIRRSIIERDAFAIRSNADTGLRAGEPAEEGQFSGPELLALAAFETYILVNVAKVILETGADQSTVYWAVAMERVYAQGVRHAAASVPDAALAPFEILRLPTHLEAIEILKARQLELLKNVTTDMAANLRKIVAEGLRTGTTRTVLADKIAKSINGISFMRAQAIAATEITSGHAEATLNTLDSLGVRTVEARVEFTLNVHGFAKPCPICIALAGRVFTISEARGIIPVHPRCLPGDALVTSSPRITGATKRRFEGEVVVFTTASGKKLICTPNHPVLTQRGFLPAHFVDKNLDSLRRLTGDRKFFCGVNDEHVPASIKEISEAFLGSGDVVSMPVPVTAPDFHGDGIDGQIAIVGTNGLLRDGGFSEFDHQSFEQDVVVTDVPLSRFDGFGAPAFFLKAMRPATGGDMSGGGQHLPLDLGEFAHSQTVCLFPASHGHAERHDAPPDGASINAVLSSQSLLAGPGPVQRRDLGVRQGVAAIASLLIAQTLPDRIVSIDVQRFCGHVFNLETEGGWFASDDLIVSNCQCGWVPIAAARAA